MVFPSGWSWQADKTKHDTQDSWSYMQLDQLSPTVGNNSVVTSPFLALTVRYHSAQRTDLWDGAHGAAGCPSSPADLLGWLCWDFSVDLPFWSTFGTYKQEILGEVLLYILTIGSFRSIYAGKTTQKNKTAMQTRLDLWNKNSCPPLPHTIWSQSSPVRPVLRRSWACWTPIHWSHFVALPHLFLSFPPSCYKSWISCLSEFQSIYKISD